MTEKLITLSGRDYALLIAKPTLRDQFAMAALTGLLANSSDRSSFVDIAVWAYQTADYMIKVREEKE